MIASRLSSLKEVAEAVCRGGQFTCALRDFLDGFYAEPSPEKVCGEPPLLASTLNDGGFADAYLASVCDHLCRQYRISRPAWIKGKNPLRVLKTPYFAAKTHGLRMIYLQESPAAFRERNIFVSANALARA